MKIILSREKEYDAKYLVADVGVRYWEDATVNGEEDIDGKLIPCREEDRWKPVIDIDKGQIINWKKGTIAEIHYKVCDDGIYSLFSDTPNYKNLIIEVDGYVPSIMCPEKEGYGDYIIMNVNSEGYISKFDNSLVDGFEKN